MSPTETRASRKARVADAVKALCFDVFGTVVDWRGSVAHAVRGVARRRALAVDAEAFADAWRAGYAPAMDRVRRGELGWMHIDDLHRMLLDGLLEKFAMTSLTERERQDLNDVWHRLKPWPDSVAGLRRLRKHAPVATLSNGNVSLLVDLVRHGRLHFDAIFSAELFRHYKPDPETYLGAAQLLGVAPGELLMVAAHKSDLRAAQAVGLQTALVLRPLEYGAGRHPDPGTDAAFDYNATDFLDLASQLGV